MVPTRVSASAAPRSSDHPSNNSAYRSASRSEDFCPGLGRASSGRRDAGRLPEPRAGDRPSPAPPRSPARAPRPHAPNPWDTPSQIREELGYRCGSPGDRGARPLWSGGSRRPARHGAPVGFASPEASCRLVARSRRPVPCRRWLLEPRRDTAYACSKWYPTISSRSPSEPAVPSSIGASPCSLTSAPGSPWDRAVGGIADQQVTEPECIRRPHRSERSGRTEWACGPVRSRLWGPIA